MHSSKRFKHKGGVIETHWISPKSGPSETTISEAFTKATSKSLALSLENAGAHVQREKKFSTSL